MLYPAELRDPIVNQMLSFCVSCACLVSSLQAKSVVRVKLALCTANSAGRDRITYLWDRELRGFAHWGVSLRFSRIARSGRWDQEEKPAGHVIGDYPPEPAKPGRKVGQRHSCEPLRPQGSESSKTYCQQYDESGWGLA